MKSLLHFDTLSKRDFDNGAVIHAIRLALQERERLLETKPQPEEELVEKCAFAIAKIHQGSPRIKDEENIKKELYKLLQETK